MTGSLAQQFAQVRDEIDDSHYGSCRLGQGRLGCTCGKEQRSDALAALSSIERHVQDMETALRAVGHIHPPGHFCGSNCPMYHVAALPAHEREEE